VQPISNPRCSTSCATGSAPDPAIAKVFADIGHHDGRTGRIADLLGALARPGAHPRAAVDLLAHLASSIDSFEDAHGGRR